MARLAMLIDLTRCIGCDACTVACKQENGTPMDVFFARVLNIEVGSYPQTKRVYLPMLCYHCENPACLKACPNKAIFKRPDGVVLIDQDRCRGTGACTSACPYGNVFLKSEDSWYLNEDEPYERDFVKPRLKQNVARKCTYCVQRVDVGLDPACVVACPTKARIFGDMEDAKSEISTYIEEQIRETGRHPFKLLPQAGTQPAGSYLGTMAEQNSSTMGGRAGLERAEPLQPIGSKSFAAFDSNSMRPRSYWKPLRSLLLTLAAAALFAGGAAQIQAQDDGSNGQPPTVPLKVFTDAGCGGCHGPTGTGGMGPKLAGTKMAEGDFAKVVREGKGAMPAFDKATLSDDQIEELFKEMQVEPPKTAGAASGYAASSCMACHGQSAMGGLGPPIAQTKKTAEEFLEIVRTGRGMMPASKAEDLSDAQVAAIYDEVKAKPWDEAKIPAAFKVGQILSTKNVGMLFGYATLFALFFGIKVWIYWIKLAAPKQLWPAAMKLGFGRTLGILAHSLVVDGFLVSSVWKRDRFRWFMHGLMLYGFCGLFLADMLMQAVNPLRSELPLFNPLKLLAVLAGTAVLIGICYVFFRYRKDAYIDNGMTRGRDLFFVNLVFLALITGFATYGFKSAGMSGWVMPIYLVHLAVVLTLIVTAPFTRFMHVWIAPTMVALTRLQEAVAAGGVDLGFQREPSPGRHHKSQRIAEDLMAQLGPQYTGEVKLRYYP